MYRIIEGIGRWSMVDVFMIGILAALVALGNLATIAPGAGAIAFCGVVIVTILAAMSFDPRLMWDAANERRNEPTPSASEPPVAAVKAAQRHLDRLGDPAGRGR